MTVLYSLYMHSTAYCPVSKSRLSTFYATNIALRGHSAYSAYGMKKLCSIV